MRNLLLILSLFSSQILASVCENINLYEEAQFDRTIYNQGDMHTCYAHSLSALYSHEYKQSINPYWIAYIHKDKLLHWNPRNLNFSLLSWSFTDLKKRGNCSPTQLESRLEYLKQGTNYSDDQFFYFVQIYFKKEQEVLLSAINAYSGLILAREKLDINEKNLNLLNRQVENDKIRLDRGQITITDLAQSESSLAGAQAQFTQAQNDLLIAKLTYENIIGKITNPNDLQKSSNSIVNIPTSLKDAIDLSKQNNPDIKIAKFDLEQSEKDLAIAKSDLAPTASLSLERSYAEDVSSTIDEREKDVLKATVSWPFYSGGKKFSTINKNSNLSTRQRLLLDDAIRTNETNVSSMWSSLESSKSFLASVKAQVRAAQIANDGIVAEYERGSRTTLDVIQSNALLLSAQISLASSEKNYLMAQYNVLKAVGLLNSQYLNLE